MCDCEKLQDSIDHLAKQVTGWTDALQMAPTNDWEYSEPMFVGGITGDYKVSAPFRGECQFSVCSVTAANPAAPAFARFIISPNLQRPILMTAAGQSYTDNSPLYGIVLVIGTGSTIPLTHHWYDVGVDSLVYVSIVCDVVAGVNFQFRQKR